MAGGAPGSLVGIVSAGRSGRGSGVRSIEIVLALVALGAVGAAFANRLRIPPPSLLVLAGLVVGLLPGVPAVRVSPDVVSFVVLPPLLWAATDDLPWRDLRAVWRPVVVLAVGLVLASAGAVAGVLTALTAVPLSMAFVLGAVLASTDPVAVSALGRRLSLPPRLQALVQGESLFNDATSLVLFQIAVSFAVSSSASAGLGSVLWHGAVQFVVLAAGGALAGGLIAAVIMAVRSRITDPVLESVVALVTPYMAYVLGTALHLSGVTAVIVAGLIIGTRRTRITTAATRLQVHAVYQTVIFLLESVVFSLIGLELPTLVSDLRQAGRWPLVALAIAATLIVTRVLWVFPLWAGRQWRQGQRHPSWAVPAVVSWAGTRGVVPLAAALSIPLTTDSGAPLPQRDLLRAWSDRHEGVGNVPVPVARGVHQLAEHCGQLGPAGRGELPQDPGQLLLPPVCDLAHQSVTGSGQLQRHHAAVSWLASPDHMACGDHPVSQPGHRGRFQSQGPGYLYRAGAAKLRQHGEHPELRERHCPAEHIHAAQRHAGQDPGDHLQGLDAARRQFRLVRSLP
jgi:CPA1 family monovalent cation:H+ antiporter